MTTPTPPVLYQKTQVDSLVSTAQQVGITGGARSTAFIPSWNISDDARNPMIVRTNLGFDFHWDIKDTTKERSYVEAIKAGGVARGDTSAAFAWMKAQSGATTLVLPPIEDHFSAVPCADALQNGIYLGTAKNLRGIRGLAAHSRLRLADNVVPPLAFNHTVTVDANVSGGSFLYKLAGATTGQVSIPIAGLTATVFQTKVQSITGNSGMRVFGPTSAGVYTLFADAATLPFATTFSLDTTAITLTNSSGPTVVLATSTTNPYHLLMGPGTASPYTVRDLTLDAGTQSNIVNVFRYTGTPTIQRVKVLGGWGNGDYPPAETTVMHAYKVTGGLIEDVEIDGMNNAALLFGNTASGGTASSPLTMRRIRAYNSANPGSHGISLYECGHVVIQDAEFNNCEVGFNVEEAWGPIRVTGLRCHGNRNASVRKYISQSYGANGALPGAPPNQPAGTANAQLKDRRDLQLLDAELTGSPAVLLMEGRAVIAPFITARRVAPSNGGIYCAMTKLPVPTELDDTYTTKPYDVITSTFQRGPGHPATDIGLTSGVRYLAAIRLVAGMPIKKLRFYTGSAGNGVFTFGTAGAHAFAELFDPENNLLCQSADNATSKTANAAWDFAVAKDSVGTALSSFVPGYTGEAVLAVTVIIGTGGTPAIGKLAGAGLVGADIFSTTDNPPFGLAQDGSTVTTPLTGLPTWANSVYSAIPGTPNVLGQELYGELRIA